MLYEVAAIMSTRTHFLIICLTKQSGFKRKDFAEVLPRISEACEVRDNLLLAVSPCCCANNSYGGWSESVHIKLLMSSVRFLHKSLCALIIFRPYTKLIDLPFQG